MTIDQKVLLEDAYLILNSTQILMNHVLKQVHSNLINEFNDKV